MPIKSKQHHTSLLRGRHKQTNTTPKTKILVAMSGGVDSSVAAALLVKSLRDYDVTGAFMVNYQGKNSDCWRADYQDALRVAAKLGIQLIKLDFTQAYKKLVLDYMFNEYRAGRTPNPDILCNKFIKFGVWLDQVRKMGFNYLATGHYANIKVIKHKNVKIFQLLCAKDKNKDQTYFLHQLAQNQLKHTLFPIGNFTKTEVRKLAKQYDLPTADKSESMGICFVGEVPMKKFLQTKIKPNPGEIILTGNRQVIGQHEGLAFYTIGQRHLKVQGQGGRALYVVDKNFSANQLIVGCGDDPLLSKKEISLKNVHWLSGQKPIFPLKCKVRLRHQQPWQNCQLRMSDRHLLVKFVQAQKSVAPGQFAVFYLKNNCLGGGVIT